MRQLAIIALCLASGTAMADSPAARVVCAHGRWAPQVMAIRIAASEAPGVRFFTATGKDMQLWLDAINAAPPVSTITGEEIAITELPNGSAIIGVREGLCVSTYGQIPASEWSDIHDAVYGKPS